MPDIPASIDIQLRNGPVEYTSFEKLPEHAGGECAFLGRTRRDRHPQFGVLKQLSYDAYPAMAEDVLRQLSHAAVAQFQCLAVRVHHALGEVPVGEASVLVQVATAHRAAAFEACRFLIDELKTKVPIWKREIWSDGHTWSEGHVVNAPADDA
jgi:molybdopterin synthase catalytic subunit